MMNHKQHILQMGIIHNYLFPKLKLQNNSLKGKYINLFLLNVIILNLQGRLNIQISCKQHSLHKGIINSLLMKPGKKSNNYQDKHIHLLKPYFNSIQNYHNKHYKSQKCTIYNLLSIINNLHYHLNNNHLYKYINNYYLVFYHYHKFCIYLVNLHIISKIVHCNY